MASGPGKSGLEEEICRLKKVLKKYREDNLEVKLMQTNQEKLDKLNDSNFAKSKA